MPNYHVNRNAQANGDNEVHENGCRFEASISNRYDLGYHLNCAGAVQQAKRTYSRANGCYYCCRACHTS